MANNREICPKCGKPKLKKGEIPVAGSLSESPYCDCDDKGTSARPE